MTGYRLHWAVELFHKSIKQQLGFKGMTTHGFDTAVAYVYRVYGAYIPLHMSPPGLSPKVQSIGDKQRALQQGRADPEKRHILQKLPQIGDIQRYKDELRRTLLDAARKRANAFFMRHLTIRAPLDQRGKSNFF